MWFDIPNEHLETLEAKRLLALTTQFHQICADEQKAYAEKANETDPIRIKALAARSGKIQSKIVEAVAEFDRVTGEPKPVDLSNDVLNLIAEQFTIEERKAVTAKLSKTLAYLRRGSIDGERVIESVLKLANGKMDRLLHFADEAKGDFRNVLYWIDNAEVASP